MGIKIFTNLKTLIYIYLRCILRLNLNFYSYPAWLYIEEEQYVRTLVEEHPNKEMVFYV